ncbi:hypothetical protein HUO09_08180 [Vibrio sp. Y2-5]|uniref:hypothetical protein n=1 Tax=Vibrio TaxID=662 RepID=UPI00142E1520|nr:MULTISPECIES: hypothetical protein [Vibrio]MBD0786321.1 hypothetical protein [Vibrio sp. Y2-5]NIY92150.1 hypothetical protein [Vibrio diazotrophicus]
MRYFIILSLLLSFISVHSNASTLTPTDTFGTLTVDSMTEGRLLWLNGRVGEADYKYTDKSDRACTVKVPIAVGRFSDPDLGISKTKGLTIVVVSQRLNDALIQGERVNSEEWHFTAKEDDKDADGLIARGISPDEEFILNSRRKWVSWFLRDKPNVVCN